MIGSQKPFSLRDRLLLTILLCWVLPILIVMSIAGILVSSNFEQSRRHAVEAEAENALDQVCLKLERLIEDSKSVSYDGVVRNSYRLYEKSGDEAELYRTVNEYLNQNFTHNDRISAVFISFWDLPHVRSFTANRSDVGYHTQREYRDSVEADLLEKMHDVDTGILLTEVDGKLYMARNLLSSQLKPYATVVLLCDTERLLEPLHSLRNAGRVSLTLDETMAADPNGTLRTVQELPDEPLKLKEAEVFTRNLLPASEPSTVLCSAETDGHSIRLAVAVEPANIWSSTPHLTEAAVLVILLVLPLLGMVIWMFHRLVARPMNILTEAETRLQSGERGYQITEPGRSREFQTLFTHFNAMSSELKLQFDNSRREQQALQQAKIKALQSQINPHFLNNTLEVINWEARIDGNERVCAMLEALSVMLDAALDREDRGRIPLREELRYVDAYLYIIRERLGERLEIHREIGNELLEVMIPRLILQPIVENAVEHDITVRRGGHLTLRAREESGFLLLEVEHEGLLTEADRESLRTLLNTPVEQHSGRARVGLRNVRERLDLLYGAQGELRIVQTGADTILASVRIPVEIPEQRAEIRKQNGQ